MQHEATDLGTDQLPERPIEQTGVAMTSWLNRHLGLVLGALKRPADGFAWGTRQGEAVD